MWGANEKTPLNVKYELFQSTHPCGVRKTCGNVLTFSSGFNPRTRVGCEPLAVLCMQFWGVSIHAPVWGANGRIGLIQLKIYVSIHAPVWGANDFIDVFESKS